MGLLDAFWGTSEEIRRDRLNVKNRIGLLKLIPPTQVLDLKINQDGKIFIPAQGGYYIRVGEFLNTFVGGILILKANGNGVVFTIVESIIKNEVGKTYFQLADSFKEDRKYFPLFLAAKKVQPMMKFAIIEINFMMGIATAMSGGIAKIDRAISLIQYLIEIEKELPKWIRILRAIFKVDSTLKKYAPNLRQKTTHFFLAGLVKGTIFNTTTSFIGSKLNAENLAKILGSIVGLKGEKAIKGSLGKKKLFMEKLLKISCMTLLNILLYQCQELYF